MTDPGANTRETIFFLGLVLFGIGNGLLSAPVIALMLDISAEQASYTAMLLGFYGVILTIGRFNAAWITGVVLVLTGENYAIVFILEAIFLLLTWVPIHFLTQDNNYTKSVVTKPLLID